VVYVSKGFGDLQARRPRKDKPAVRARDKRTIERIAQTRRLNRLEITLPALKCLQDQQD
jgi:hypothetical protein